MRTCVACGTAAPKASLLRLALVDGQVILDEKCRLLGRGAYVHPDRVCAEKLAAMKNRGRIFRRPLAANAFQEVLGRLPR